MDSLYNVGYEIYFRWVIRKMKLVILDRDGVINEDSDSYIKNADEWLPIAGSIEAIGKLYQAGFTVVVATNQSGLGRGLFNLDDLEAMHAKMNELIIEQGGELAGVFYCPHHPIDNCDCRKPKAGLITAIERELGIGADGAHLVGDSLRDLQAGKTKNCIPVLVKTGKGENTLAKLAGNNNADSLTISEEFSNLAVFDNLAAAAQYLIELDP